MSYKAKELINGVVWSAIDKFGIVGVQLILEIFMARLLLPKDYGIIGMVAVFIAIGQVFVDSGFGNALIQKTDRTEIDYSTVFYFNIIVSGCVYFILFFLAPYISLFYNEDITSVIRVISLTLIFNSFIIVHRAKLSISLNFKAQAKFSLLSVVFSGVIGLSLAYYGYGVWALIYQTVALAFFNSLFFWLKLRWMPLLVFSKDSFSKLFYFGSKLLVAAVIQALYFNLYSMILGKKYEPKQLGLYTKANQFTLMPVSMLTSTLQRVMYPFLSSYQNDDKMLFDLNIKYSRIISVIFFSLFFGIAVLAEPIIVLLLSNSWIEMVPVMRILSVACVFYPFIMINMTLFQVKGNTKAFLKIEILTKIIGIILLFLTYNLGLKMICYGILFQFILQMILTSIMSNKLLSRNIFSQFKIILPILILSILASILVFFVIGFFQNPYMKLLFGATMSIILYGIIGVFFLKADILDIKNKYLLK